MVADFIGLNSAYKNFLQELKVEGRSPSTILAYGCDLKQFIKFLADRGKVNPDQVSLEDLKDFKESLKKDGYTLKSVSRKINSLRTFFRFLSSKELIKENLALRLSHPKVQVKPPRILSKTEYRALRDACRGDLRISAIVELLLQTGLRVSELANLNTSDLDHNFLNVSVSGKNSSREIPLNRAAKIAVENYLKVRPETKNKALFVTKKGTSFLIRNIRTSIDRYFKEAGIKDAKLNDLRHTFIVQQLRAGIPLTTVSELVGHKRITTTEKYLQFTKLLNTNTKIRLKEL